MDKSGLAKRAKEYQAVYDFRLPLKTYAILQLDGKAFHTFTRGMERPFDERFMNAMNQTAVAVLKEISNANFAYVQSDEINILVTDFAKEETEAYFANRINKVVSTAASVASVTMSKLYPEKEMVTFDARFFAVPTKHAVWEFFLWRQVDAIKNSIQLVAQSTFTKRELFKQKSEQLKQMLTKAGISWENFSTDKQQGRLIQKQTFRKQVTFQHKKTKNYETVEVIATRWEVEAASLFKDNNFLKNIIPDKPE